MMPASLSSLCTKSIMMLRSDSAFFSPRDVPSFKLHNIIARGKEVTQLLCVETCCDGTRVFHSDTDPEIAGLLHRANVSTEPFKSELTDSAWKGLRQLSQRHDKGSLSHVPASRRRIKGGVCEVKQSSDAHTVALYGRDQPSFVAVRFQ